MSLPIASSSPLPPGTWPITSPVAGAATPAAATSRSIASAASTANPAAVVTLAVAGAATTQTYSPAGRLASPQAVWESLSGDATSTRMAADVRAGSLAGRWAGLGRSLLDGVANGGGDYSQSVLLSSQAMQGDAGVQSIVRQQLHDFAANSIGLSVFTRSGAKLDFTLSADDNGVAVRVKLAHGQLDSDARAALARLGDAFQSAIDGLAQQPPQLALDGLMQFDRTALTSIDLHASFGDGDQVIDLQGDASQRKLSTRSAAGTLQLAVNLDSSHIAGSAAQQQRALARYLEQFDAAVKRGHGDAGLATLYKQAFAQLNSHLPATARAPSAVQPSALDRQLLSGLADFNASLSQASVSPNPLHPEERDSFDYQVSQQTSVGGRGQGDRRISQQQQSSLRAAYHEALQPDLPLRLGTDRQSQNYTYHQIDDQASSQMDIAYQLGYLDQARLSQSARQDTHVSKTVEGQLVQDTYTPLQSAIVRDFAAQLQAGLAAGRDRQSDGQARWQQWLQEIGAQLLLQADPTRLGPGIGTSA